MQDFISTLTIWALPVLFAITLHEAAHGYAARHFGDRTAELGEPMLSSTLLLPDEEAPLTDAEDIRERLEKEVDLIIEAGPCRGEATTIIDLTSGTPELIREGRGSLTPFGL